jgi:hypothetical protein
MQIARNSLDTQAGPSDWFTGAVYIDTVAAPSGHSRLSASSVHFTPARAPPGTRTRTDRRSTSSRASPAAIRATRLVPWSALAGS